MGSVPPLLSFLLMMFSGWVYRHQLIVIEFLQAENRLLKQKLGGKRLRFTDAERALLARKAKAAGRKALLTLDTVVLCKYSCANRLLSVPKTRRAPLDRTAILAESSCQSFVMMMQATEFRKCDHPTPVWRLHRPRVRCIHR
jgi:hypothetical protein